MVISQYVWIRHNMDGVGINKNDIALVIIKHNRLTNEIEHIHPFYTR